MYSIKNKLKIGLLSSLFVLPFLVGGVSYGANDLLRQIMDPAINTQNIIDMGENVNTVGKNVFEGSVDLEVGGGITKTPSIIVKVTRLLLILVITLSVTMILYNGMMYIMQTGQGKEGKSLIKNIVYIVVGILISLFSVVIITLIQSVPETIDQEVRQESNNRTDNKAVGEKEEVTITELIRGSYAE